MLGSTEGIKQKSRIVKITLEHALGSTVLDTAHLSGRPSNIVFLHTVGRDCVYFTDTRQSHWPAPRRMTTMSLETLEPQSGGLGGRCSHYERQEGPKTPASHFSLSPGHMHRPVVGQNCSHTSALHVLLLLLNAEST